MATKRPVDLEEVRAHVLKLSKKILKWENAIQDARQDLVLIEEIWGIPQPEVDGEEWVEVGTRGGKGNG